MMGPGAGATTLLLWAIAAIAAAVGIAGTPLAMSEATMSYGFLACFAVYALVRQVLAR